MHAVFKLGNNNRALYRKKKHGNILGMYSFSFGFYNLIDSSQKPIFGLIVPQGTAVCLIGQSPEEEGGRND